MTEGTGVILRGVVFLGATLQRVAGMGFAMVVSPVALLLLSGQQGVVFTNLLGALAARLLMWLVRARSTGLGCGC